VPLPAPRLTSCPPRSACLCFILPPAATSTLFPYTTLFRSSVLVPLLMVRDDVRYRGKQLGWRHAAFFVIAAVIAFVVLSLPKKADRKSTRLNSSHVSISYAVFCLKKKTRCGRRGTPRSR